MLIPGFIKSEADQKLRCLCETRIPSHFRDKVRLSVKWNGSKVTLIEHRPYFLDPSKWTESQIAQLRYDSGTGVWSLFCSDRNHRWHAYGSMFHSKHIDELISEINQDPTGIFWG